MRTIDPPIIVEQFVQKTPTQVWSVITELNHMQEWFFDVIHAFEAVVGFETQFTVRSEERIFPHLWTITEVNINQKISYNWRYEGYPGDSFVHFELVPQDGGTLIRLTTEIIADFPQDIPEFKIESCIGGWNYFIKDSLPKYLDSI